MRTTPAGQARVLAPWLALLVVVVVGLVVGTSRPSAPATLEQRTLAIAKDVRCPSCEDLTAAESNAVGAVAVRNLIRTDLSRGLSESQIDSYLVDRYGPDIILRPPATGLGGVVWWLPALAAVLAAAGAALALRRWRPSRRPVGPDAEDRRLVHQALEELS